MKIILGSNFQRYINLTDVGHVQMLIFLQNLVSRYFLIPKQAFQVHERQNNVVQLHLTLKVLSPNAINMKYIYIKQLLNKSHKLCQKF